jgi:hypothetical protein
MLTRQECRGIDRIAYHEFTGTTFKVKIEYDVHRDDTPFVVSDSRLEWKTVT